MTITVLSADEYEPQPFDAVLVRENTVVCVATDVDDDRAGDRDDLARTIPLGKVNHVDAAPDQLLSGTELPDWFYGGGAYGFVAVEAFPELSAHLEDLHREDG